MASANGWKPEGPSARVAGRHVAETRGEASKRTIEGVAGASQRSAIWLIPNGVDLSHFSVSSQSQGRGILGEQRPLLRESQAALGLCCFSWVLPKIYKKERQKLHL